MKKLIRYSLRARLSTKDKNWKQTEEKKIQIEIYIYAVDVKRIEKAKRNRKMMEWEMPNNKGV